MLISNFAGPRKKRGAEEGPFFALIFFPNSLGLCTTYQVRMVRQQCSQSETKNLLAPPESHEIKALVQVLEQY